MRAREIGKEGLRTHARNDSVEAASSIPESVLASGQFTEVASCLGDGLVIELEDDSAAGLRVDGNVKLQD